MPKTNINPLNDFDIRFVIRILNYETLGKFKKHKMNELDVKHVTGPYLSTNTSGKFFLSKFIAHLSKCESRSKLTFEKVLSILESFLLHVEETWSTLAHIATAVIIDLSEVTQGKKIRVWGN